MYFKKAIRLNLPAGTNQSSANSGYLKSSGSLSFSEQISATPKIDLSNQVFSTASFSEKARNLFNKNWLWLLLGTGVLVACIVVHEKNKRDKKRNQLPINYQQ